VLNLIQHFIQVVGEEDDKGRKTGKRVFASIAVITDRPVLDRQLQRTVRQSEQTCKAKAMIVTGSCLHAVRYKLAVDQYLKEQGYSFKALVAFSGTGQDGGMAYTEANMNGFPETQTAESFKRDECRVLIVANKFQSGCDQPLLHTMSMDRKLSGVHAVQTLSRLNRVHPGKEEMMVLSTFQRRGRRR
jgi:type I site-specific restriction-modification system R (restriction) subunit